VSINLSDLGNSPYIASDDYAVGSVLGVVTIERIDIQDVPTPGKSKKDPKAVAWFKGQHKGYVITKNVGRAIAKKLGSTKNIDKAWLGASIQLEVVGDVRRPDGTKGNAFRLKDAWPAQAPAQQQQTAQTQPAAP
jgi:hypothetical protein